MPDAPTVTDAPTTAALAALVAAVEEIQWNGYAYVGMQPCVSCGREPNEGHAESCSLDAALRFAKTLTDPTPSFQSVVVGYLEARGWYFDWDRVRDDYGGKIPTETINGRAVARDSLLRTEHAWTVPQWADYWMKPYSDDPTHENYGTPKTRRYENMRDAISSQLHREEEPETFGRYFGDPKEES